MLSDYTGGRGGGSALMIFSLKTGPGREVRSELLLFAMNHPDFPLPALISTSPKSVYPSGPDYGFYILTNLMRVY